MTERHSPTCLNCGASLDGKFCGECGQRDVPPYPSVRELALDAVAEFSGWDGRLSSTLRALVRRPGFLTLEFLEGRRARYVSPLRVYLTASLVYFLLAAAAPKIGLDNRDGGLRVTATRTERNPTASRAARVGEAAGTALERGEALSAATRDSVLRDIETAPGPMRPFLRRAVGDPDGFKRGIADAVPRMVFALLPVFAGIVALFYRGRKYPEHLYFAIHLHAFIFLALSVSALFKFLQVPALAAAVSVLTVTWIPVYALLALRRVYGGTLVRTVAKGLAIAAIYAVTALVGFAVVVYWVSLWG